ncbi:MAG: glycosyltransferase [Candidatus Omnitrophica bacterium]|nr:glycosyltransferase [Candidatus Omnitrophota bacterium]
MRIILATPQDKTVLGVIGSYCKAALQAQGNEVSVFDFRKEFYAKSTLMQRLKSAVRSALPFLPSLRELPAVKLVIDDKVNRMLLDRSVKFKPDILLVLCGENISLDTLIKIKNVSGTFTVNWFYDTLISPHRESLVRSVLPCYDYLFIVDSLGVLKRIKADFNKVATLPLACEPLVHKRVVLSDKEARIYGSDVAFVGTVTPEREKILEELSGFNLKIWGRWSRKSACLNSCYQKKDVYAEEAVKIYNSSKIILDVHSLFGREKEIYNVTPRLFEVPASGAFLLTNYVSQVSDFYKIGEEIITYGDVNELKNQVSYYLKHPDERINIAERGYQRAHKEHTYANRVTKLLETVKNMYTSIN